MSATPQPAGALQVAVDWSAADDLSVMAANVFLVQQTGQEFLLTFGSAVPPIFMTPPTPEQIQSIKSIKAKPIIRLALTPGRIVELLGLLQQQLAAYQQTQAH